MLMPHFLHLSKKDILVFLTSIFLAIFILSSVGIVYAVSGSQTPTLTATVTATMTFTVSSLYFGNIAAGDSTYGNATSTLNVNTNNTSGWFVTLYGNEQATGNTAMDLDSNADVGITDQLQWIAGAVTTTGGNAVVRASLDNTQNVLAFRVMSASSTNGAAFLTPGWWGNSDVDGTAKWTGVASTTNVTQIGNASTGSLSASNHLNTVLYYLKVASSQQTGAYSGPLTYTATSNP